MINSELREVKQHGTKEFPIEIYSVNKFHPKYVMATHWHDGIEIIRIFKGEFELFLNNRRYVLRGGDIAFINSKELHRGNPTDCEYECIVFDIQMLKDSGKELFISYIEPLLMGNFAISSFKGDISESTVYNLIDELSLILREKNPFFKLKIMSKLYLLLEALYTEDFIIENPIPKNLLKQSSIVGELVWWIDEHYKENITLSSLAASVNLSQSYLCKIFKEYTGKTPIEYVNSIRIDNICAEISEGEKNITAIALNNGYNDISYFCKVFKKFMGVSAKKYAKTQTKSLKGF